MKTFKFIKFILFLFIFRIQNVYGKLKILALSPYNGKSHFLFTEILFVELAKRGHDVTVVSQYPRTIPLNNYHDISMVNKDVGGFHTIKIDDVTSKSSLITILSFLDNGLQRICREGLSHPNVKKLIKSNDHYDIIIAEMFNTDCFLGFAYKFKAPLVLIRTASLSPWLNDRTGNPDNPSYIPASIYGLPSHMNFIQRFKNTFIKIGIKIVYGIYNTLCEQVASQHFGKDMPSLDNIAKNASLYLINTHFVHQYSKPLLPHTKDIAGMHIKELKPLPQDLEDWISGAKHGCVYFSFGSMISSSSIDSAKWLALLQVLALLPHRVLLKWDVNSVTVDSLPDNIKLTSWTPQSDVLHHPNVKLFITHAGMQGVIEAVHAGVPMLAIPFFGDQPTNAELLQERGLGLILQYSDITFDTFNKTIHELLYDPGYTKRAKELSAAFRDRPMHPLDEAIYWIEYVARHKGTAAESLMRSAVLDLALYEYLLLDVLAVVILVLLVIWLILRFVRRLVVKLIFGYRINQSKKKS